MKFEVTATVKVVGPVESVGAKGFQKRNLVLIEPGGQYENLICVEFSGDKLAIPDQCAEGQVVTVSGFVNSREWNGKYFTSLRGSFISGSQTPAGDNYPQDSYPSPSDINEAPAFNQSAGFAQQVPPAPNAGYAAPQTPAPTQGYTAPQNNLVPPMPEFPSNGIGDTDIPF